MQHLATDFGRMGDYPGDEMNRSRTYENELFNKGDNGQLTKEDLRESVIPP